MPDCENIEMQQIRRLQELQQENERLSAILTSYEEKLNHRRHALAELEEKCQELSAELEATREGERWVRREYELLGAQMEIVKLIFGGRKGGGCGGCY